MKQLVFFFWFIDSPICLLNVRKYWKNAQKYRHLKQTNREKEHLKSWKQWIILINLSLERLINYSDWCQLILCAFHYIWILKTIIKSAYRQIWINNFQQSTILN